LIVKHILAFTFVGTGVYLWRKFNRKVKAVRQTLETGEVSREVGQEVCREA
jgi:hypothetical protein